MCDSINVEAAMAKLCNRAVNKERKVATKQEKTEVLGKILAGVQRVDGGLSCSGLGVFPSYHENFKDNILSKISSITGKNWIGLGKK